MEDQNLSSQDQEGLAGEVMESLGEPEDAVDSIESSSSGNEGSHDPLYVQKRLKQQRRAHEREMREMQARMAEMQSRAPNFAEPNQATNPYTGQSLSGEDERIHRAVSLALQQKELEERKAKDAEQAAYFQQQEDEFEDHLNSAADKYDDFDDVVRKRNLPFTKAMRAFAMTLPYSGPFTASDLLYKLGKNPSDLERISKLPPIEQTREMNKLAHASLVGGDKVQPQSRPLGSIKSNPATNSHAVTEKTPIGDLRRRMKAGWK